MLVTVYVCSKDGRDTVYEASSLEEAVQAIEEGALDSAQEWTEEENEKRFPMYWSVCELGATDICASGYVNEFGEMYSK